MKNNAKFFGIALMLILVVTSAIIGGKITGKGNQQEGTELVGEVSTAKLLSDETISMEGSKYRNFTYNKYENPGFGFKIEYPSFLTEKSESHNGDGIILKNPENTVVLIVSGMNNGMSETPKNLYEGYVNNTKGITYKKLIGNAFMISAENGNNVYFIYEVVGKGSINTFVLGYPKEDAKTFEGIIKQMKQSFETPFVHQSR